MEQLREWRLVYAAAEHSPDSQNLMLKAVPLSQARAILFDLWSGLGSCMSDNVSINQLPAWHWVHHAAEANIMSELVPAASTASSPEDVGDDDVFQPPYGRCSNTQQAASRSGIHNEAPTAECLRPGDNIMRPKSD